MEPYPQSVVIPTVSACAPIFLMSGDLASSFCLIRAPSNTNTLFLAHRNTLSLSQVPLSQPFPRTKFSGHSMMTGTHSTSPRKPQLGLFQDDPLFHGAQLAIRVLGAAAWRLTPSLVPKTQLCRRPPSDHHGHHMGGQVVPQQ